MTKPDTEALAELRLRQLELMLKIRFFEERLEHLVSRGDIGGTCHVCIGQEAVAVGVLDQVGVNDKVVSSHRGHGHLIAKGGDLTRIFAEFMGRKGGYCMGRGGTQHLCAASIGFYGTNGITGGNIPVAAGLALAAKKDGDGSVAVSFFGDGAVNQGTFHETLNMAVIWKLPVVFVCENNLYAMSTHIGRVSNTQDLAKRAEPYGMPALIADGCDIADIEAKAKQAVDHARAGRGPFFLEAKTYRHRGHSKSDNRAYRSKEEEQNWLEKDCVKNLVSFLDQMGYGDRVAEVEERARLAVAQAEAQAVAEEFVDGDHVSDGVRA